MVAGPALQHRAGVGDLGRNDAAGEGGGGLRVGGLGVLGTAEEDIARLRPQHAGQESAVHAVKGERDAGLAAGAHQERAAADVAEADDSAQVVQRHAEAGLLFHADQDIRAFHGQIGPLGRDVEGVVVFFHSFAGHSVHRRGVGGDGFGTVRRSRRFRWVRIAEDFANAGRQVVAGRARRRQFGHALRHERTELALRPVLRRRRTAGGDQVVEPLGQVAGMAAEVGVESHRLPPPALAVVERAGGHFGLEHFFQAQCLGAELHEVRFFRLAFAAFVFDGERLPAAGDVGQRGAVAGPGRISLSGTAEPSHRARRRRGDGTRRRRRRRTGPVRGSRAAGRGRCGRPRRCRRPFDGRAGGARGPRRSGRFPSTCLRCGSAQGAAGRTPGAAKRKSAAVRLR